MLQSNVPGVKGSAHIIGGSDLLVHTRGKNSELDEWLKDAAEVRPSLWPPGLSVNFRAFLFMMLSSFQEERQSRRDESLGDDLFR